MHANSHASGGLLSILVEGTNAYHYLLVVQTNSGTGGKPIVVRESTTIGYYYEPIVVRESTTIGYYYEPIVVRASTNTGRPADLY